MMREKEGRERERSISSALVQELDCRQEWIECNRLLIQKTENKKLLLENQIIPREERLEHLSKFYYRKEMNKMFNELSLLLLRISYLNM